MADAKAYAQQIGLTWVGEAALPGAAADAVTQVLDLHNKGVEFIMIQNVVKGTAQVLKAVAAAGPARQDPGRGHDLLGGRDAACRGR